jgi:hypothetical protein
MSRVDNVSIDFGKNSREQTFSKQEFISCSSNAVGYVFTGEDFQRFVELNLPYKQQVTGGDSHEMLNLRLCLPLRVESPAKQDEQISVLNKRGIDCKAEVARLTETFAERDGRMVALYSSTS